MLGGPALTLRHDTCHQDQKNRSTTDPCRCERCQGPARHPLTSHPSVTLTEASRHRITTLVVVTCLHVTCRHPIAPAISTISRPAAGHRHNSHQWAAVELDPLLLFTERCTRHRMHSSLCTQAGQVLALVLLVLVLLPVLLPVMATASKKP